MKYLSIKRKDGSISTVRYECESVTEKSLTYEEEIIKELYHKIAELEQENRKKESIIADLHELKSRQYTLIKKINEIR